jgi:uncharacterized caspase-like protein
VTKKAALIIGNRQYQDSRLAALTTPGHDAERLAAVLRDPEVSEFDDVSVMLDEPERELRRAIARFFSGRTRDDLLLFYFSGHGVRDEDGALFLASADTDLDLLTATSVPASFVRQELDRSRSRRVVILLDCCNSGAFHHGAKSPLGGASGMLAALSAPAYGRVILTATDAVQMAWEGQEVAGATRESLFTRYVVKGLETGEADKDGDGAISVNELYDYVYEQVVNVSSKQTPQRTADAETGSLIIGRTRWVRASPLPPKLLARLKEPEAWIREAAVDQLKALLGGDHPGLSRAAYEQLRWLAAKDDSRSVSKKAAEIVEVYDERQTTMFASAELVQAARAAANPKPRIMVSYRRSDSIGHVLVILQKLGEQYGPKRVVRDGDHLTPGKVAPHDVSRVIENELATSALMLVVMGPDWTSLRDPAADRPYLKDPKDPVRAEIAAALRTKHITVIPVLVDGAEMPSVGALPSDVQALASCAPIQLSNAHWPEDMKRLIDAIEAAFAVFAGVRKPQRA